MENIDERDIEAARLEKRILILSRELPGMTTEGTLKLAVFLLFTDLTAGHLQLPWSWADTETANGFVEAKMRATAWLGIEDDSVLRSEWERPSQLALDKLRQFVTYNVGPTATLKHLDFLVKSLGIQRHSNSWARKVESFVADFSQGWSVRGKSVLDLNTMATGELGVRFNDAGAGAEYVLPVGLHPFLFEVCLRLRAHNVQFRFSKAHLSDSVWNDFGAAYMFAWSTRNQPTRDLYEPDQPLNLGGLEFAQWFIDRRNGQGVTIVVLPTADLRAKGRRAGVRRELLLHRRVLGVVDIPVRVSGTARLSLLVMATGVFGVNQPVLMMNGRAVDGLRDEPLDRLAQFLSRPFMGAMMREGHSRKHNDAALGVALSKRAGKMYESNVSEVPGFFRYVNSEEILNSQHAVLDPSKWIPARDPIVASDLLDGTPVFKLLEKRDCACCVYVIGNNGAGKSLLLRQLAKAYVSSGRPVRTIASATSDRFETKMSATADYVYLGARTSDTSTQPRRLGRKLADLMVAIHTNNDKVASVNSVLEQLSFAGQYYLLPEAATSDVLESVRKLGEADAPVNLTGWKIGFRKKHENSIVPFDHLSTGEQQLLLLTARLVEYAGPGVVFLVDEPETSLHVAWQRALPSVFQTISRNFTCQIVIATHSPVLISTSQGRDTIRFMADGGVLEVIGEQAASSIERVLFQGFDTYTRNNREVHERCAELVSRAIEFANTEQAVKLPEVLNELSQMEEKVTRSIPALGSEVTALHLNLIRRAKFVMSELSEAHTYQGAIS